MATEERVVGGAPVWLHECCERARSQSSHSVEHNRYIPSRTTTQMWTSQRREINPKCNSPSFKYEPCRPNASPRFGVPPGACNNCLVGGGEPLSRGDVVALSMELSAPAVVGPSGLASSKFKVMLEAPRTGDGAKPESSFDRGGVANSSASQSTSSPICSTRAVVCVRERERGEG